MVYLAADLGVPIWASLVVSGLVDRSILELLS